MFGLLLGGQNQPRYERNILFDQAITESTPDKSRRIFLSISFLKSADSIDFRSPMGSLGLDLGDILVATWYLPEDS